MKKKKKKEEKNEQTIESNQTMQWLKCEANNKMTRQRVMYQSVWEKDGADTAIMAQKNRTKQKEFLD